MDDLVIFFLLLILLFITGFSKFVIEDWTNWLLFNKFIFITLALIPFGARKELSFNSFFSFSDAAQTRLAVEPDDGGLQTLSPGKARVPCNVLLHVDDEEERRSRL